MGITKFHRREIWRELWQLIPKSNLYSLIFILCASKKFKKIDTLPSMGFTTRENGFQIADWELRNAD